MIEFTSRNTPQLHLLWNTELNEPEVMQKQFGPRVRITWNPDDDRFYVEELVEYTESVKCEEWETVHTFAGNRKGWQNALDRARTRARNYG